MSTLLLAAWLGCQAFDMTTTAFALRNPAIQERNPVMRGSRGYALKIGVNVGLFLWTRHDQSPAGRTVVPLVMASVGCAAGLLNVHTLQRANK
jgi:hypothetical protein